MKDLWAMVLFAGVASCSNGGTELHVAPASTWVQDVEGRGAETVTLEPVDLGSEAWVFELRSQGAPGAYGLAARLVISEGLRFVSAEELDVPIAVTKAIEPRALLVAFSDKGAGDGSTGPARVWARLRFARVPAHEASLAFDTKRSALFSADERRRDVAWRGGHTARR